MEAWLGGAEITEGPVFRSIGKGDRVSDKQLSGNAIAEIVKRYARAAGLDPALFSGHSLRAGFVTSALEHGADIFKVMVEECVSIGDAARIAGKTERTIRHWCVAQGIGRRIGGRWAVSKVAARRHNGPTRR